MEIELLLKEIKEAAYQVRLALAPGYLESVYRNALLVELRLRGLKAESECPVTVSYKGFSVGEFRADIIVENKVILELKACRELTQSHHIQLINYLMATGIDDGYLINYGAERFSIMHKTRIYSPR